MEMQKVLIEILWELQVSLLRKFKDLQKSFKDDVKEKQLFY